MTRSRRQMQRVLASSWADLGWRGLRRFFILGARSMLSFRLDVWISLLALVIQVALLMVVWRAVYGDRAVVAGIGRDQAVAYAVLAVCLQTMLMPWNFSGLPLRVRRGLIAVDLTRPQGLIGQNLAQSAGTTAVNAVIGLIGVGWAAILGAARPPHGWTQLATWVLSLVLALALALLLNLLVSMVTFWTTEVGGAFILYRMAGAFASGAMIPLWFMPPWLAHILGWLPFQAQVFAPLSLYFGTVTGLAAVTTVAVQASWVVIIAVLLQVVWLMARRRVVVLGG